MSYPVAQAPTQPPSVVSVSTLDACQAPAAETSHPKATLRMIMADALWRR
jgi:hypothetical protein